MQRHLLFSVFLLATLVKFSQAECNICSSESNVACGPRISTKTARQTLFLQVPCIHVQIIHFVRDCQRNALPTRLLHPAMIAESVTELYHSPVLVQQLLHFAML
uniref:IP04901p n=1 Tax=Drosophila melanogaster TaxID=7227 RepID=Q4V6R0_DROME|nr:IP04901p [Drosophila melanogaster]